MNKKSTFFILLGVILISLGDIDQVNTINVLGVISAVVGFGIILFGPADKKE